MMRHWLISFMAACATGLCAAAGGSPLDEYLLFELVVSFDANGGEPLPGVLVADFVPVVKIAGKKTALSIRTNLWMDRKDASEADARFIGEAKVTK